MFDFLDKFFDFDKNGRLDPLEKAARDAAFLTAMEEVEKQQKSANQKSYTWDVSTKDEDEDKDDDEYFEEDDDDEDEDESVDEEESEEAWKEARGYECSDYDREQLEGLEDAGIDVDEFEYMDDDEKREILEENGLEPYDYDLF